MDEPALIDVTTLHRARSELGINFLRILGYFRDDGSRSLDAIEVAMRQGNAAALVIPSHTLKGEARQFGAEALADLAETIEAIARDCVERRDVPSEALEHVIALRPLFEQTLLRLERDAVPTVQRRPTGFGRRVA